MKLKFRKIIYQIPVIHKLCRCIINILNKIYYNSVRSQPNIQQYKNTQTGKRCFIIGNGPSLRADDLEQLINEDCFGMNYIFKVFTKTKWRPKYYLTQDAYGIPSKDINALKSENIFIGAAYWRKNHVINPNAVCYYNTTLPFSKKMKFSEDVSKIVYDSCTVTYSALQFAAYMGYSEIYLIGMDTDFSLTMNKQGKIVQGQARKSHFYQDNKPSEIIYNETEIINGYLCAKKYCDAHGIKIYNATRGGKLEIFERVGFDTLFKKGG